MTVDRAVLERVLAAIDVETRSIRRVRVEPGGQLVLDAGEIVLAYVVEGAIGADAFRSTSCAVHAPGDRALPAARRRILSAGDAFLALGRQAVAAESDAGARLMVATIGVSSPTVARSLPDVAFVAGFAELEPAAAALAAQLGPADDAAPHRRSGDPVICRIMITTVLLSVIRAWASAGCAPQGWPSAAADPFLEKVVAAIHDDPGRDWTVDALAAVGAMSRTVFAARFRAAFGRSPAGYVADVRMRRAKELLDSGHSVSETSRVLGYTSDEGFSRAFRRHVGVVPSTWRARRRESVPA